MKIFSLENKGYKAHMERYSDIKSYLRSDNVGDRSSTIKQITKSYLIYTIVIIQYMREHLSYNN